MFYYIHLKSAGHVVTSDIFTETVVLPHLYQRRAICQMKSWVAIIHRILSFVADIYDNALPLMGQRAVGQNDHVVDRDIEFLQATLNS